MVELHVVLITAVWQRDSVICVYIYIDMYILFHILFHYGLSQNIEGFRFCF